jgi:hypothetical protein
LVPSTTTLLNLLVFSVTFSAPTLIPSHPLDACVLRVA